MKGNYKIVKKFISVLGNLFLKNILTQIFRDQFLTVVHDKNSAYIQLDVVLLLPVFKQIKGCTSWDKQESSEFQLPFHREVLWESKIIVLVSMHGSHFSNCLTTLQTQKAHSNHLRFQKKLSRQDTGQEQALSPDRHIQVLVSPYQASRPILVPYTIY